MNHKISVCIIVKNAQATLKECLESLKEFDEIILLDNGSEDSTLQIAQDFNANYGHLRIEQSEFIGFGALKNLAVSYAKNEWILSLDSDEVLESSALQSIKALNLEPHCIYAISRKNLYKGEWIKACGWSPDFVWRIFNKNFTRFNENIVHESVIIPKEARKIHLQGHIKHYACSGIPQLLDKLQRYTTLYAEQNTHSNKKATMSKAITHFAWGFVKNYFFKKGVFYGYKGFVLSLCNALGSFFKYAKLYEAQRHKSATPQTTSLIITTYNQKERLALVLDSVRKLNPLPKEVLIADDGSKADTREVIQSYARDFPCELRHIWHEDKGFRLAQIRNEAIKEARGDYIIIIDGDMILDSRFVAEHLRFARRGVLLQGSRVILREDKTAQILEAKNYALAFDSHSLKSTHCDFCANLIYKFSKTTAKIFKKTELIKGIRGCNMSFYKADCEAINGFNEEFVGWGREDSEFVARFLFKGGELRRVKFNALAYHLYHAENPRSALESNHNIYIYIYAKLKRLGQKWACKKAKSPCHIERSEISQKPPHLVILSETQCSEVSKTREFKRQGESRIEKRINELDSPLQHCDSSNLMSNTLDSSLVSLAQNDKKLDSPKKRALITLKDITEGGGGERVGVNLANALTQNLGYEVQIISFFRTHKTPIYPLDSRIFCTYLRDTKAKSKNPLTTLFRKSILRVILCLKTHKIAKQINADIVLANDGWFIPLFKRKSRDFKPLFVRLWHLKAPKKARRKLRLFDTLVVLSSRELPIWQRYHSNVHIIPNFLPQIPQKSTDYAQKVVLSVGRMDNGDQKGFLRLLDIWKMVTQDKGFSDKFKEWKLTIVGDGILKSEIQAKINALNLQDSIILKPFTKDIEREYLGASIYAMSSHFEGFPMVLVEVSSYALPCIAFDVATGPSDIIAHTQSGYLIADNDLESYAKHLITLMSDESMRIEFGSEAKRRVSERFSKEVVMEKWGEMFGESDKSMVESKI